MKAVVVCWVSVRARLGFDCVVTAGKPAPDLPAQAPTEPESAPEIERVEADIAVESPAASTTIEDELRSVAPVARQTLEELLEKDGNPRGC